MPKLASGSKVPDFSLPMSGGATWRLQDAAGKQAGDLLLPART